MPAPSPSPSALRRKGIAQSEENHRIEEALLQGAIMGGDDAEGWLSTRPARKARTVDTQL